MELIAEVPPGLPADGGPGNVVTDGAVKLAERLALFGADEVYQTVAAVLIFETGRAVAAHLVKALQLLPGGRVPEGGAAGQETIRVLVQHQPLGGDAVGVAGGKAGGPAAVFLPQHSAVFVLQHKARAQERVRVVLALSQLVGVIVAGKSKQIPRHGTLLGVFGRRDVLLRGQVDHPAVLGPHGAVGSKFQIGQCRQNQIVPRQGGVVLLLKGHHLGPGGVVEGAAAARGQGVVGPAAPVIGRLPRQGVGQQGERLIAGGLVQHGASAEDHRPLRAVQHPQLAVVEGGGSVAGLGLCGSGVFAGRSGRQQGAAAEQCACQHQTGSGAAQAGSCRFHRRYLIS